MNLLGTKAVVRYRTADIIVEQEGDYVLCAVSGKRIPLDTLLYWSEACQEAYAGPKEATQRWLEAHPRVSPKTA